MLWAGFAAAEPVRIATFAAPLSRDGPGLLLRDIQKGEDDAIIAIAKIIDLIAPDVLVLTDFDYDLDGYALDAFAGGLAQDYPYRFALTPNTGVPTGLDIDGNGRRGDARDAQGYGRFVGDGGMAILSRFAVLEDEVQDFSQLLWRDLDGAQLPSLDGKAFFSPLAQDNLRLSSAGHWVVPLAVPDGGVLSLMVFAATPPVFDGPEDMNGLRNRDELRLWENILETDPPEGFVVLGNANLDPVRGAGKQDAMQDFLRRPDLMDPLGGQPNADWGSDGPGQLRVSYILPSTAWQVVCSGTFWPDEDTPERVFLGDDGTKAGPHRMIWVDLLR